MRTYDYIITGMGASGLMLAYYMVQDPFFKQKKILLLDQQMKSGNDRTWCFWEKGQGILDTILHKKWNYIYFGSDTYKERISIAPYAYKMIRSSDFYTMLIDAISQHDTIKIAYENVTTIEDQKEYAIVKTDKNSYTALKVFNSIVLTKPNLNQTKYPLLNQHFIGWFIKAEEPVFEEEMAKFMDFTVPQHGNTRFMYVLPLSPTEALLEYTLFSEELLPEQEYEKAIRDYIARLGIDQYEITEKEKGCIPMTSYPFWKHNSKNVIHIGTAGGWTKASTGFTFANSQRKVTKLIKFLKENEDVSKFEKKTKFWFYDVLFLDVLFMHNELGASLFSTMFQKNKVDKILKFLDEETTLWEDLKITTSLPWIPFLKALWARCTRF